MTFITRARDFSAEADFPELCGYLLEIWNVDDPALLINSHGIDVVRKAIDTLKIKVGKKNPSQVYRSPSGRMVTKIEELSKLKADGLFEQHCPPIGNSRGSPSNETNHVEDFRLLKGHYPWEKPE